MSFLHRQPFVSASAVLFAVVAWVTWPQVPRLATHVVAHADPLFSMWRLGWIAHAVRVDPHHLFDANVFHPEVRTLAYSDATLLEGALAAPLLWAGASPVIVYNLALLGGMWASGFAMFALARRLTASDGAGLVAGVIFAVAPYRIDHVMHLELQWAMWIPLALLALHDAIDRGSWRSGAMVGVLIWLQVLSCVYYGVFLALTVAWTACWLLVSAWRNASRAFRPLAIGGALAVVLTIPYAAPYVANARALGPRNLDETVRLSAMPVNYVAATAGNWMWGWTAERFGGMERCLFPGAVAGVLAAIGLAARPRPIVWAYAGLCAFALELSFGLNGWLYAFLYNHVPLLKGLRAPVRFAIVVLCALSILAAFGMQFVEQRLAAGCRLRAALATAALALLALEYTASPTNLMPLTTVVPDLYRVLAHMPRGVVLELPVPRPESLPGNDATFEYWSMTHWKPLVNGYSGYYPEVYLNTLQEMRSFPNDESIARLKRLEVRYLVLHEDLYDPREYAHLLVRLGHRPDLVPTGQFRDWSGQARLFELAR